PDADEVPGLDVDVAGAPLDGRPEELLHARPPEGDGGRKLPPGARRREHPPPVETHALAHLAHRLPREGASTIRAGLENTTYLLRVLPELGRPFAERREGARDVLRQDPLAVHAPAGGAPALHRDVLELLGVPHEEAVQRENVADLGTSGIGAPHPLRVGHGRADLRPDLVRLGQDPDGVAERLAHLRLAVEAEDAPDAL